MSHTPWHGDGGTHQGKHKDFGANQFTSVSSAYQSTPNKSENTVQKEKELKDWGEKKLDTTPINPNINKINSESNNEGKIDNTSGNSNATNVPKYPTDKDLESDIPQGNKNWVDTTAQMNSWQTSNDTVNTFFTNKND